MIEVTVVVANETSIPSAALNSSISVTYNNMTLWGYASETAGSNSPPTNNNNNNNNNRDPNDPSSSSSHIIVIGAAVGGAALLLVIVIVAVWLHHTCKSHAVSPVELPVDANKTFSFRMEDLQAETLRSKDKIQTIGHFAADDVYVNMAGEEHAIAQNAIVLNGHDDFDETNMDN
jgi:hypothetical protein